MTELKLMRVGMNMEEAEIAFWKFGPGDRFEKGDVLYAIETDKVSYDVEADFAGLVVEILVGAGEIAMVGQTVARVAETG